MSTTEDPNLIEKSQLTSIMGKLGDVARSTALSKISQVNEPAPIDTSAPAFASMDDRLKALEQKVSGVQAFTENTVMIENYEAQKRHHELQVSIEDLAQRKRLTGQIYNLICLWLCAVVVFVACDSGGLLHFTDAKMVALLCTATATVLGLFATVTNYFFRNTNSEVSAFIDTAKKLLERH